MAAKAVFNIDNMYYTRLKKQERESERESEWERERVKV